MNNDHGTRSSPTAGFSLIELMLVLVIVAILAVIAMPTYTTYLHRTRRVDGQQALLKISMAEERFYATNNHYGDAVDIGYPSATSEQGYYLLTVVKVSKSDSQDQGFIATATPTAGQVGDDCGALAITETGEKTPDAATGADGCW